MNKQNSETSEVWIAKHQICELQRLYAKATDLLCLNTSASVAEATAIYHQIFTPQAEIKATGMDPKYGPDAWVALVLEALDEFSTTQHMIGTQLAEVQEFPVGGEGPGQGTLFSHLQAWHAKADGDMWHYIGIYESAVVYTAESGWQIEVMNLISVSEDYRKIFPRP